MAYFSAIFSLYMAASLANALDFYYSSLSSDSILVSAWCNLN